jgi:hypothetical protein
VAVMLGPEERGRNAAVIRNLEDGSQREVLLTSLGLELRAMLGTSG